MNFINFIIDLVDQAISLILLSAFVILFGCYMVALTILLVPVWLLSQFLDHKERMKVLTLVDNIRKYFNETRRSIRENLQDK